ncbi:hypothetical protein BO70DRAFT_393407 [Aspergillus heteromorphus CBS 117.55]|uniref:Uncharacterized protein n=1 Tax=Aspergillus heteromorphus CBS 117.55 TaxID=1448321 RepID=A0A317X129_9EURO|nr:uncharacterized protein BO70DRAFT_393407 [Aspergillus heteromorphus CBS 117.55]PWY90230.1 hypothetical protein BO70DRAFT_393407 [Aspergillus heteromorphus CBS 117.55]
MSVSPLLPLFRVLAGVPRSRAGSSHHNNQGFLPLRTTSCASWVSYIVPVLLLLPASKSNAARDKIPGSHGEMHLAHEIPSVLRTPPLKILDFMTYALSVTHDDYPLSGAESRGHGCLAKWQTHQNAVMTLLSLPP